MDEIPDGGSGSEQGPLSVSPTDKGSKYRRKLGDPSIGNSVSIPQCLAEFLRYESPKISQSSPSEFALDSKLHQPKVGAEQEAFGPAYWDDPIACQLEELLFSNLQVAFQCAIRRMSQLGYSEEAAEKRVSSGGFYRQGKDPVMNIVNDSLKDDFTDRRDAYISRDDIFDNLKQLVEYTMLEIIGVVRDVRPFLSIGEVMWWLLLCDLNVIQACALQVDPSIAFGHKDVSGENSDHANSQIRSQRSETILPNPKQPNVWKPSASNCLPENMKFGSLPATKPIDLCSLEGVTKAEESLVSLSCTEEKSSGPTGESVQITSPIFTSEEKSKGRMRKELAALRQRFLHLERGDRMSGSRGGSRSGKFGSVGFVVEKRLKPPSELPVIQMKNASSKNSSEVQSQVPLADGSHPVNKSPSASPATENNSGLRIKDTISVLPTAEAKLPLSSTSEMKSNPKPQIGNSEGPKIPDYYAGIPYDKSLGKYLPQNEKDEMILKLVPRLQELQDELQGWTEWANQKVMQAAHRLCKDQPQLKALRLEKGEAERNKIEKQMAEENTLKKLTELENALISANERFEIANSATNKIEEENSVLRRELEAARFRALGSAASYRQAVERELVALKKAQSQEGQKALLKEELEKEKHKGAELQQELGKDKNRHRQIEARYKHERTTKEKLLAQAASIKQERERLEAKAKAQDEATRQKAESVMQEHMEDIKKLENKLSELKLKSESSKIAALRRGADRSYGIVPTDSTGFQAMQQNRNPHLLNRAGNSQNRFGTRRLKQDRECAMCLSEDTSVVFLPCSHQVMCAKCNELLERQGMKDCAYCRTPIEWRINVRFAR
ncbi:putative E3 ubiquitin-protein ligase RF298 [Carya illinoinensis]|uniref:RING-type domain-containing protein n=1 Tax=Carya illinoinensis TaxID=32201 RepID=A0A8T1Q1E1_CARIL|nr:putative E3 ubiquitin-protein ligase RF298 [Carya illinoinensis]XP_042986576.1 putative E3 ubiquitin-protein ligase RF298 [Carya illinoinensis]XP_042986577.1 putative E3 ubiquitin-protein ligase RF298 [Carya illinoinensis]KAG6647693.1 hypothetical protein CIPAW_07G096400 [Carya illinoinensis]KAG6647694.1 hypothetical protein CIPAW_07G096400 [Carya illinoinensis]